MKHGSAYTFSHAICRRPAKSIVNGLRAKNIGNPVYETFVEQHDAYVNVLENAGCQVTLLDALDAFPDSVFVEDAALCLAGTAIVLRPGAASRFGEAAALAPALQQQFPKVMMLAGSGTVDGGDILVTDTDIFIGQSERTNSEGIANLASAVEPLGYRVHRVDTPDTVLHLKSDCGLLDSETIFVSQALADANCFPGYQLLVAPEGESAAANLIRVNHSVLMSEGYPHTHKLLNNAGYQVITLCNSEAAKVDGGLSCMSLRFTL